MDQGCKMTREMRHKTSTSKRKKRKEGPHAEEWTGPCASDGHEGRETERGKAKPASRERDCARAMADRSQTGDRITNHDVNERHAGGTAGEGVKEP
ncbi:uncharacterized protein SPSK_06754 [Sporothrix schenckii 1099-18]|uniref:Uncharacterized protein n=1 Tax=Sporothrix schenckii 1099-18 TaxID=1397361 RepID=A0A0F2MI19_SPOSC|nr:uncharacterized protein SPSK_06754 [Sporothrix schenckii 1099-18]KJR89348.1 hypothetical protein SPSK_06754 [Sporothrix schenckii 1099-18]